LTGENGTNEKRISLGKKRNPSVLGKGGPEYKRESADQERIRPGEDACASPQSAIQKGARNCARITSEAARRGRSS